MGMSMDIALHMFLLTTVKITRRGGDTLVVHTTVDSVDFSVKSPMLDMLGGGSSPPPMNRGDTSVVLMSTRGAVLQHLAGSATVGTVLGSASVLPETLAAGDSWLVPPVNPSLSGGALDASEQAAAANLINSLAGSTSMTYVGVVDRDGARAWRFNTEGRADNLPMNVPHLAGVSMAMTVKQMRSTGSSFVDLRGRVLHLEQNSTMSMEGTVEGSGIATTSSSLLLVERVR
jgi:hypothetical protein